MGIALVLGGGAPNMTLMAGALHAFDRAGVEFEVISTAGAGMLIGLLYAAPKGVSRQEALLRTQDLGVHDWIYSLFPVNYKVFHKPGLLAEAYTRVTAAWQPSERPRNQLERLALDWWKLQLAAWCPTDLSFFSQGLCQPAPWIEEVVDFGRLRENFAGDFYLSAYCVEEAQHVTFAKEEITHEHFRAALAMPLIYSPYRMGGKTYLEGAAQDALNYKGLIETFEKNAAKDERKIENIVVFDVLGLDQVVRQPRNLYDAWVKSIIVPLVAIAKDDTKLFEQLYNREADGTPKRNLMKVDFTKFIPDERWDKIYDWSYSNLSALFEIGQAAGVAFLDDNHEVLLPKKPPAEDLGAGQNPGPDMVA